MSTQLPWSHPDDWYVIDGGPDFDDGMTITNQHGEFAKLLPGGFTSVDSYGQPIPGDLPPTIRVRVDPATCGVFHVSTNQNGMIK